MNIYNYNDPGTVLASNLDCSTSGSDDRSLSTLFFSFFVIIAFVAASIAAFPAANAGSVIRLGGAKIKDVVMVTVEIAFANLAWKVKQCVTTK